MKILFSFCNTTKLSRYYQKSGLSQLAILDTSSQRILFVKISNTINTPGFTGLAEDSNYFYILAQKKKNPHLIKMNKRSLSIVKLEILAEVGDPHSLVVDKESVYVCSTATNTIEEYNKDSFIYKRCYWQHPDTNKTSDQVHLNSIFSKDGNIYASCFGKRKGDMWSSAKKGYIINTSNNKTIFEVYHPHSAVSFNGDIYYCGSSKGIVYKNSDVIRRFKGSYIRGLDMDENCLVIGLSGSRQKSRSTGIAYNSSESGKYVSKTGIAVADKKTKRKKYYDVSFFEKEIYDVLIINDSVNKLYDNIIGISRISKSENLKENNFITGLVNAKESLEKKVLQLSEYQNKVQSSRFYKVFKRLMRVEEYFNGEKIKE